MNIKEINDILDQEIKFSSETPLIDTLDENFVDGFIKGLRQSKFLLNSFEEQVKSKPRPHAISLTTTTNVKEGGMLWMTPEGKVESYSTSGYLNVEPEPIPNLNKILEKYDGIIITGARGSGKTITAMKIINYLMQYKNNSNGLFVFPTTADAIRTMKSSEYKDIFKAQYHPSRKVVGWENKSIGHLVSAENPLEMHGLQYGILWLEEVGSFKKTQNLDIGTNKKSCDIFDLTAFGHRLNYRKIIITGTEYKEAMKGTWLEKLNLYTYNLNLPI